MLSFISIHQPSLRLAFIFVLTLSIIIDPAFQTKTNAQTQVAKIIANDGEAEDFFGNSVSIDNNVAIVAAYFEDTNGWGAGAAYIFRNANNNWVEEQKLIGSEIDDYDFFGTSVGIAGNVAVVGAPFDRGTGTAYVFRYNGTTWIEEQILQASDGLNNEMFGQSVSISSSGNMIVVGAIMDGLGRGSAYVFTYNGSTWVEQQNIYASDGVAGEKFGSSISVSEDESLILIGDVGINSSGKAHVFMKDGTTWVRTAKLLPANGTYGDGFGASVSISNNYAVVGARYDDVNFIDCGSAHIYKRSGNNWQWHSKISASDRHEDQRFGYVSISSELILVGATHDNQNGLESGAAYVFKLSGNTWLQAAKILPDDGFAGDWFGSAVKIREFTALISAPYDNDNGANSGSAYIFDLQNLSSAELPSNKTNDGFSLNNNYPNPFNAATSISWYSPEQTRQTLKIFDILGREVSIVVDEIRPSGYNEITFDASGLTSGVYYYQLRINQYIRIKGMVLLK